LGECHGAALCGLRGYRRADAAGQDGAFPIAPRATRLRSMDSAQLSDLDFHTAKALLEWQIEFGVDETMCDAPVNRFEVKPESKKKAAAPVQPPQTQTPPIEEAPLDADIARDASARAQDINGLRTALETFDGCEFKSGAKNLVFSDGKFGARVMVIGEAPGRDDDQSGKPFTGQVGTLLDNMLKAIDLSRAENVYLTNAIPWRLPRGHDVTPEELAMLLPFLERHVALAKPDVLVLMGNLACQAVLGKSGITRLRGSWADAMGLPVMPMFHPEYLLNNPEKKRDAWADLLALKAKL